MQFRTLPQTDLDVSAICLGTMTWGQQNTEADAHEQLDYAVAHGVNFIDTAEMYPVPPEKEKQGLTESYIGSWIQKRGRYDDLVIASKVASRIQSATMGTRDAGRGLTRENIYTAIDQSLKRLHVDHIDLYQVHVPDRRSNYFGVRGVESLDGDDGASIEETLTALAELIQAGKVRYIGVSNETPWGVSEYLRLAREKGLPKIVTIQNQYSLLNRTFEIGLSEQSLRENVGLLAFSALNMGVLTGKYLDGAEPPGARFTLWERNRARYNPPHAQETVRRYVEIAKKHGLDPAEMAIAFATSRSFVTSTIIGATNLEQLKTDIAAEDISLSEEILVDISLAYKEEPDPTC